MQSRETPTELKNNDMKMTAFTPTQAKYFVGATTPKEV